MKHRALYAVLVAVALGLTLSVPAAPARAASTFVVLQMNLCNSGKAHGCYSFGRAVDEAVEKIHRYPPELVTVQEVCRDDLYAAHGWGKLARAMADRYGADHVAVDFVPAGNRYTGGPYHCVNGRQYGIALLYHYAGRDTHHGWYAAQDSTDETRAWVCATVIPARLTACTTHLSTEPDVAVRQCRELTAILAAPWVAREVVVAGDLNLTAGPVGACAPRGYQRAGDGIVQHVLFSPGITRLDSGYEAMRDTDHPLLYQRLRV